MMEILESIAQGLGIGLDKQFQIYTRDGDHIAAAVFKQDGLRLTSKTEECLDPDAVLGGLISGNLVPKTRVLDHCPFCGGQKALVQRMRFTRGGQIQIMYTVYCPDCQAHGPLAESEDAAADGWNE